MSAVFFEENESSKRTVSSSSPFATLNLSRNTSTKTCTVKQFPLTLSASVLTTSRVKIRRTLTSGAARRMWNPCTASLVVCGRRIGPHTCRQLLPSHMSSTHRHQIRHPVLVQPLPRSPPLQSWTSKLSVRRGQFDFLTASTCGLYLAASAKETGT